VAIVSQAIFLLVFYFVIATFDEYLASFSLCGLIWHHWFCWLGLSGRCFRGCASASGGGVVAIVAFVLMRVDLLRSCLRCLYVFWWKAHDWMV